jgi:hypothetical protein
MSGVHPIKYPVESLGVGGVAALCSDDHQQHEAHLIPGFRKSQGEVKKEESNHIVTEIAHSDQGLSR